MMHKYVLVQDVIWNISTEFDIMFIESCILPSYMYSLLAFRFIYNYTIYDEISMHDFTYFTYTVYL